MATRTASSDASSDADYARHIAALLRAKGYTLEAAGGSPDYDFVAARGAQRIAVRGRHREKAVGAGEVNAFLNFIDGERGRPFTEGWLVASNRLTSGALKAAKLHAPTKFEHWWCKSDALIQTTGASEVIQRHVGVFTCKGGVGKSTVSLLLGCALAARNHDVVIMDLNPAQNLYKLVGGSEVQVQLGDDTNAFITVFGQDQIKARTGEWKGGELLNAKYILYDCPQFFTPSSAAVLARFELIVSPIGLSPLGMGMDHSVLIDTVQRVRKINPKAPIVFIVNGLKGSPHYGEMRSFLMHAKARFTRSDRVLVIDPGRCAIPFTQPIEDIGMDNMLTREQKFRLVFATLMPPHRAAGAGVGKLAAAVRKILP